MITSQQQKPEVPEIPLQDIRDHVSAALSTAPIQGLWRDPASFPIDQPLGIAMGLLKTPGKNGTTPIDALSALGLINRSELGAAGLRSGATAIYNLALRFSTVYNVDLLPLKMMLSSIEELRSQVQSRMEPGSYPNISIDLAPVGIPTSTKGGLMGGDEYSRRTLQLTIDRVSAKFTVNEDYIQDPAVTSIHTKAISGDIDALKLERFPNQRDGLVKVCSIMLDRAISNFTGDPSPVVGGKALGGFLSLKMGPSPLETVLEPYFEYSTGTKFEITPRQVRPVSTAPAAYEHHSLGTLNFHGHMED